MDDVQTPKLRPGLQLTAGDKPETVVLIDHFRLGGPLQMSKAAFDVIRLFDGQRTLAMVQSEAAKMFEGGVPPLETLQNLVQVLDQAYFLDTPRLRERLNVADRPPSCVGSYEAEPERLKKQLKKLFTAPHGPGLPGQPGSRLVSEGHIRGVLLPHMDYHRGGVTYGWGFKELVERTDASLFVVIATSHYSPNRFTLTRQNFTSPLGRVETDQKFIDTVVQHYGPGLFDDPFAHAPEHSIELEVVGMQFLFHDRPFRIVPLLVGSFFDCVRDRQQPREQADIARMIAALQAAEAAAGERVCYIISGDLAHIGPKFDDPDLVSEQQLSHSRIQDDRLLDRVNVVDTTGYFDVIAEEEDVRRICGLPPTYIALNVAQPKKGRVLHYGRYVHPEGFESVSFASAVFE